MFDSRHDNICHCTVTNDTKRSTIISIVRASNVDEQSVQQSVHSSAGQSIWGSCHSDQLSTLVNSGGS